MQWIPRAHWNARSPAGTISKTTTARREAVAVHYSAANKNQTVRQIQNYHMDSRGWIDIGYNALVDVDGIAYEGRAGGWLAIGAHAEGQNTANIGICCIGTNDDITPAQMNTVRELYDKLNVQMGKRLAMRYHGELPGQATACPGPRLIDWVKRGMPYQGTTPEEDQMTQEQFDKIMKSLTAVNTRVLSLLLNRPSHVTEWSNLDPTGVEVNALRQTILGVPQAVLDLAGTTGGAEELVSVLEGIYGPERTRTLVQEMNDLVSGGTQ